MILKSPTASNNTATHTLTSSTGCDSVVTLDLTINNSITATDVITACDSFTWIDNNTYTSSNNTATHTLTGSNGCDSVVALDLMINTSTSGTDVVTACDSFTWIDNNTYTSSNNTATYALTNAEGCDSVVTLDLTINSSTSGTDVVAACDSYTWIDNNMYTSSNNTATYTLSNAMGCDSIVTLDLTIHNSISTTALAEICDGDTIQLGGALQTTAGTYTDIYTAANGCDSTLITTLTVNPLPNTTLSGLANSYCRDDQAITLIGSPAGGNYSGPGVVGSSFNPDSAGVGTHTIAYSFTDTNGCTKAATKTVQVDNCTALTENALSKLIQVYPNPNEGKFIATLNGHYAGIKVSFVLKNSIGQNVLSYTSTSRETEIDISGFAAGVYFLEISIDGEVAIKKIVKR